MNDLTVKSVSVDTPARLHLGFLDMNADLGRKYGSLGLCIENIQTRLSVTESHRISAEGPAAERAVRMAENLIETLRLSGGVHIQIDEAIPEHVGLGSGTQLGLAVGTAICRLKGEPTPLRNIARILGRGDRSGIGIGSFSHGGFLVDGGRSSETDVPPLIAQMQMPEDWRILLIFDRENTGVHGAAEISAFKNIEVMSDTVSAEICRLLLMRVLPAIAEKDCQSFGAGITRIQEHIGDYFSNWQGGRYSSEKVAEVLSWVQNYGSTGYGQSSWGPTGFAIFANETQAYQALKQARCNWPENQSLSFMITRCRNRMAEVTVEHDDEAYSSIDRKEN